MRRASIVSMETNAVFFLSPVPGWWIKGEGTNLPRGGGGREESVCVCVCVNFPYHAFMYELFNVGNCYLVSMRSALQTGLPKLVVININSEIHKKALDITG